MTTTFQVSTRHIVARSLGRHRCRRPSNAARRTIVSRGRGRVLLLGIFGLGLLYQFLLLLVLVLAVVGLLGGVDGALVAEAVEETGGKGGPPQNLGDSISMLL